MRARRRRRIQARLRATHRLLVQQTSAALEQATRRALQPHGVSGLALSFDVVRLREGRPALSPSPAPRLIWVRASYLAEGGALLARGRWLRARPDLAFCAAPEGAALALVEQAHQRPRPRLQPSQPTRRTSMGDFERHLNRTLHTIHVEDAEGTKVAALTISARIERVESWDHLEGGVDRPREPAGPHNRRIVEVPQGYAVYGHEWGGGLDLDASLPAGLDAIVARLKQDEGVRQGELVKRYGGWEPRVSARLKTGPRSSVKAGWSINYQYVHLASLSATTTPTDVWVPSSDLVPPQRGRQINAGYFVDLGSQREWECSIELYHKDLQNLVEYAENTRPDENIGTNPDNNLVFGQGSSYGAELFAKRKFGKLNGWVGYTWSKTDRVFEDLNNGDPFPAKVDRRHDLSVVVDWTPSKRWNFGAIFVYATGNTLTLPVQRYFLEGFVTDVYGTRNGYRMIPYHRADVSATFFPKKNDTDRKVDRRWVFSIYNIYNRANPYFLFFDNEGDLLEGTLDIQAKQVSLFPILPSVSWNFAF